MDIFDEVNNILYPDYNSIEKNIKNNSLHFSHYTSAKSAFDILKSKEIWFRNSRAMNDYSEIEYGSRILSNSYQKLAIKNIINNIFNDSSEIIENEINNLSSSLYLNTYIFCVSEHDNNKDKNGRLSMWRAYGGHNGVALVANHTICIPDETSEHTMIEEDGLGVYKVQYDDENTFENKLYNIFNSVNLNKDNFIKLGRENFIFLIKQFFIKCIFTTKNPGFSEENEWRFVYNPTIHRTLNYANSNNVLHKKFVVINDIPQIVYVYPLKGNDYFKDKDINFKPMAFKDILNKIIVGPTNNIYPIYPSHLKSWCLKYFEVIG
jgi:hypothetical protein